MPLHLTWQIIAVRLLLTMVAGAVIGFNRGARGHAAGLRTVILVGLAASVAMLQANALLAVGGKATDSFGVMDFMRLPLGILTGVGFIGGGAILKRGDMITGVTTAATLWVMSVIGLCFGGGQLGLGTAATLLSVLTLWTLKWLDDHIPREHRAQLVLSDDPARDPMDEFHKLVAPLGYSARFYRKQMTESGPSNVWFEVCWRRPEVNVSAAALLKVVEARYAIVSFELTSEIDP
jgi:putative Mg2+ transporter-C (MgtC) family protein